MRTLSPAPRTPGSLARGVVFHCRLLLLVLLFLGWSQCMAQAYPAKPIRIIVPFPPGNAGDVTARAMGDKLSQRLGQPIIVDNRAGAQGAIGVEAVARAAPDGYTLLVSSLSPLVITPAFSKNVPYDTLRDLAPVALVGYTALMLVASRNFPPNNIQELVSYLKAQPDKASYATIGAGTLSMLTMEMLKRSAGVNVMHVPYKGSSQALTDVIGNQVQLMFDGMTSAYGQVKAGQLKALAISAQKRSVYAPAVPTLAESGIASLHDFDVVGWTGMMAPAGTPKAVIDRLNSEVNQIMQEDDFKKRVASQSLDLYPPATPEQFGVFIRKESARWAAVTKSLNIQGE